MPWPLRNLLVLAAAFFILAGHIAAAQAPGTLISATPMPGAPENAAAFRILYFSLGLDEKPIEVSGVVIIPDVKPAPGRRPIVAWAHPTTGIVCRCAPSLARVFFSSVQGLSEMLTDGDVVTATDYPGLGTQQVHPYLVGISEGRAVLDSVRAARQVPGADTGENFAVWAIPRAATPHSSPGCWRKAMHRNYGLPASPSRRRQPILPR
jgi:Secretory lipase